MAMDTKDDAVVAASRGRQREEVGRVTSNSNEKTAVVTVERVTTHPVYKKVVRSRAKFMAHDETNQCQVGDKVRIVECRPLSRLKRWRVAEILDNRRCRNSDGGEPSSG